MKKSQNKYEDADELFKKHTIKEIVEIQKKIRNDIDRKKEDLRQLVGEKYHNLIEAADTIREMRCSIEQVTKHIELLENKGTSFVSDVPSTSVTKEEGTKSQSDLLTGHLNHYYPLVAEVKILADVPSKVWICLEDMNFLSAVKLYMIVQHTHAVLQLSQGALLQKQFPFVEQQWSGILRFHPLILNSCRSAIKHPSVSFEKIAEALCCIMLLEDVATKDVVLELLETRYLTINQICKSNQADMSVKNQICELVTLIQNTLCAVYAIICEQSISENGSSPGLLFKIIDELSQNEMNRPVELAKSFPHHVYKYLPESIINFKCKFKANVNAITREEMQSACQKWIEQINDTIKSELVHLLKYVNSVKGISQIRNAIGQIQEERWNEVCNTVLGKPLSIWDTILQDVFLERVESIIKKSLTSCFQTCKDSISQCLEELNDSSFGIERNVITYTWTEVPKDLPSNIGTLFHSRKSLWERGTLGMKARCLTPKVQMICKLLDQNLQSLLADVANYTNSNISEDSDANSVLTPSKINPKNVLKNDFADINSIYKHLGNSTKYCMVDLCEFVKLFCDDAGNATFNVDDRNKRTRMVFLGRVCEGIVELCPHLRQCITLTSIAEIAQPSYKMMHFVTDNVKIKSNPHWESIKNDLHLCTKDLYRLWFQEVSNEALTQFERAMTDSSDSKVMKTLLQWDESNIQEEADEGRVITSVIRVPFQVSLPLYTLLYTICMEVNRAVGHSLQPFLMNEISISTFDKIVQCYSKISVSLKSANPTKLVQTRALQCLFDVHYINGMFNVKDQVGRSVQDKLERAINDFEMCIDPFDLDVFTPHIQTNLANARHGTSLLFGLAMPGEWSIRYRAPYTSSNQDIHNLFPHTSVSMRFPLLPVTSNSSVRKSSVPELERSEEPALGTSQDMRKTVRSHSSSPNLALASQSGGVGKSASFYDRMTAMSSSWFGSS